MPRGRSRSFEAVISEYYTKAAEWQDRANCKGMDVNLFFPEPGDSKKSVSTKLVCRACEVRKECLEFALMSGEQFGIWGSLSVKERNRLRKS